MWLFFNSLERFSDLEAKLFKSAVHPQNEVTQDIHIIDERLVRGIVRIEVIVYGTVREELGTHIVEMVALLQLQEVPGYIRVFSGNYFVRKGIELRGSLVLQFIAQPCGGIPLLVGPGYRERHVERSHRLVLFNDPLMNSNMPVDAL